MKLLKTALLAFCSLSTPSTLAADAPYWKLVASDFHITVDPPEFDKGKFCVRAATFLGDSSIELQHESGMTLTIVQFDGVVQDNISTRIQMGYGYSYGARKFLESTAWQLRRDEHPFYNANIYCLWWDEKDMYWSLNNYPIVKSPTPVMLWGGKSYLKPSNTAILETEYYELVKPNQ